jgi:hypothetical protein
MSLATVSINSLHCPFILNLIQKEPYLQGIGQIRDHVSGHCLRILDVRGYSIEKITALKGNSSFKKKDPHADLDPAFSNKVRPGSGICGAE